MKRMKNVKSIERRIKEYAACLRDEEKSKATIEKYTYEARMFLEFQEGEVLDKSLVIVYREQLQEKYLPTTVNTKISALNHYLEYIGRKECTVKALRVQKQTFASEDKALSMDEYQLLLKAAGNKRIYYIMRAICETGIRVSELEYITVEGLVKGKVRVTCKNKSRYIFIARKTREMLLEYCEEHGITSGVIFRTRTGKAVDRTVIWREMKKLCKIAGVSEEKVFPHNLRHLFARLFYAQTKDVVRLSEIMGHSSVQTTKGYTQEVGNVHMDLMDKLCDTLWNAIG